MIVALGYVGAYVVLVGVASFIESLVGRGLGAFQLNVLIRTGRLGRSPWSTRPDPWLRCSHRSTRAGWTWHRADHRRGIALLMRRARLPLYRNGGHFLEPLYSDRNAARHRRPRRAGHGVEDRGLGMHLGRGCCSLTLLPDTPRALGVVELDYWTAMQLRPQEDVQANHR